MSRNPKVIKHFWDRSQHISPGCHSNSQWGRGRGREDFVDLKEDAVDPKSSLLFFFFPVNTDSVMEVSVCKNSFYFCSKVENSAPVLRVLLEKWLNSKCIRDPTAVQCWWTQQLAAVLQRIQAVVSSWDDLARTVGNSANGKWNETVSWALEDRKSRYAVDEDRDPRELTLSLNSHMASRTYISSRINKERIKSILIEHLHIKKDRWVSTLIL